MNGVEYEFKAFSDEQMESSPTIAKLHALSRINPINTSDPAEVDGALASSLVFLVDAIDNNAIQFESKADEGALFQMMLVGFSVVTQIRPLSSTKH